MQILTVRSEFITNKSLYIMIICVLYRWHGHNGWTVDIYVIPQIKKYTFSFNKRSYLTN